MDKQKAIGFMKACPLAVVATVDGSGKPESAVVSFAITDGFELIFATDQSSRKAANLEANSHVAVVIGWDDKKTIQYEGEARLLSVAEDAVYKETYFEKNPFARKIVPERNYYLITPSWARYTDIAVRPWDIKEIEI